jgi:hypothetical protein
MRWIRAATILVGFAALSLLGPVPAEADAPRLEAALMSVQVPGNPPPLPNETGSVRVTLGSDPGIICFDLSVSNLPNIPDAVEGGMRLVIANHTLPWVVHTTHSTGCISGFTGAQISDLFTHPQNYDVIVDDMNPDAAGCSIPPAEPCILAELRGQLAFAPSSTATPGEVPNTAFARGAPVGSAERQPIVVVALLFITASLALGRGGLVALRNRARGTGRSR